MKTGCGTLLAIVIIIFGGVWIKSQREHNKEVKRAKACNCEETSQKYWYDAGGFLANQVMTTGDKRGGGKDNEFGNGYGDHAFSYFKATAMEGSSGSNDSYYYPYGYPKDENKFIDCFHKGILEAYDKHKK